MTLLHRIVKNELLNRGLTQSEIAKLAADAEAEFIEEPANDIGDERPEETREVTYTIECRLSPNFVSSFSDPDLVRLLSRAVLFAYSFSAIEQSVEEVRSVAELSFHDLLQQIRGEERRTYSDMSIALEGVQVEPGSIIVNLMVTGVYVSLATGNAPAAGAVTAGALALWVADKFLGGAIEEFGARVSDMIMSKLGRRKKGIVPVINVQNAAHELASKVAEQRNCKFAITSGGFLADDWYRYVYQLVDCESRSAVIVEIHRSGKEPPRIQVA